MYIKQIKAQGVIGEIILFSISIFLAFALFFILSGSGTGPEQESAEVEIESSMESIRQRSALTSILNGYVWRAESVNNRYEDLSAMKLTSYYFSSKKELHIDNKTYKRQKVKEDLKKYYEDKMRQNFINVPEPSDYALNITYQDQYIELENIDGRGGTWSSIQVPFKLSGGRVGEITMYVRGTGGVFQVE